MYEEMDHSKISHVSSLPPGSLTTDHISHLRTLAKAVLPASIAEIICETETPFLQAIFDTPAVTPLYNRICLIGDAAAVLRPHSASGVVKALTDGISLAKAFSVKETTEIREALNQWSMQQVIALHKQVTLSQSMGSAMVSHTPEWDKMTPELMTDWWKDVMAGNTWYALSAPVPANTLVAYQLDKTHTPDKIDEKSSTTHSDKIICKM